MAFACARSGVDRWSGRRRPGDVQSFLVLGAEELDRLCVVLVATRNPLNMGAAARAMGNFGFQRLRVVRPYDPAFREARSAVGASEVLARAEEFPSVAAAVADCTLVIGTTAVGQRHLQHPLRDLAAAAPLIREGLCRPGPATGRVALLFGPEKTGLSNADLGHCHWLLRIPTRPEHRSMNLGQAVALCLYEMVRQEAGPAGPATVQPGAPTAATASALERITALLLEVLRASGHRRGRPATETEEMVRGLVRRLHLSAQDAEVWPGILRHILWKLRH
ncbi:MAG: RNA methyltransferase [Acidobacteriaceae bacterium]